jgi:hypothetical protein
MPAPPRARELIPIAQDLQALVHELESDRRERDESQIGWAPETLQKILHEDLKGDEIIIVSNREPYIHVHETTTGLPTRASGRFATSPTRGRLSAPPIGSNIVT